MAVENASTPDQLDASLPLGTDFKNEGDNHLRLIKGVIKNTLQGIEGPATQVEAQNITSPGTNKIMTALRVFEQVTARLATQTLAEGGTDNNLLMTSLRTKQQTDARLATGTTATRGTDGVKLMTSLGTKAYVDARLATQALAEGLTDNATLVTPLRAGQAAKKVFDTSYTAKIATQTQQNAGAADNVTTTPLKARVANDARYLQIAQTTAFTRGLLDDGDAGTARNTLGLGNAATLNVSSSTNSNTNGSVASSAAVYNAIQVVSPTVSAGTGFFHYATQVSTTGTSWGTSSGRIMANLNGAVYIQLSLEIPAYNGYAAYADVLRNGAVVMSISRSSMGTSTTAGSIAMSRGDVFQVRSRGTALNLTAIGAIKLYTAQRLPAFIDL